MKEPPIRRFAACLALAAICSAALAYTETHVNEITAPVAVYVTGRVATLSALPARTKAEKKELKLLKALAKSLAKTATALKQDFTELSATGKAFAQVGAASGMLRPPLEQANALAALSLSERRELTLDHLAVLVDAKLRATVQDGLASYASLRASADAAADAGARAKLLAKADTALTKVLKKAEKSVLADRGVEFLPPMRLRSGDSVDARGGRVAVPRDSNSAAAGASIVIPAGLIQNPDTLTITIEAAASFVGGRDLPAGGAVSVGPNGLVLGAAATLVLPYQLPADTQLRDLAVSEKGPPVVTVLPVTPNADGTVSVAVTKLSTYQPAVAAPPPGQPGGTYRVQTFVVSTALDALDQDLSGMVSAIEDQSFSFRLDHTGSTTIPSVLATSRTFVSAAPHHADTAQNLFVGSVDFTWTNQGAGRFDLSFPLSAQVTATAQGVASDDGRVIAFTGRGGSFDFFAVGVRAKTQPVTADLAGRWAGVEMGVELRDDGAEPFTTRWHDAFRAFTIDASGNVTFDTAGQRFETDVAYDTGTAAALHTRQENVLADAGTEQWTVSATSPRVTGGQNLRFGWLDKEAGALVMAFYDPATRRTGLMAAVRQAATIDTAALTGLYHLAQFDVGTGVSDPATTTSTHDTTPRTGSLDVHTATSADLALNAAKRATYTLTGLPPSSNMTWSMASAQTDLAAVAAPLVLSLDAAGNERQAGDATWYAFSTDGRFVLGLTRGEPTRLARGIAVGVK